MKRPVSSGWHRVHNFFVYVSADGRVLYGADHVFLRTVLPYVHDYSASTGNTCRCASGELTLSAFRSRYYRGTVFMR